jgi:hypothetical protein
MHKKKGKTMVTKTLVALGFIGAIAVAGPAPTLAQGVYLQGPGFGVDIGQPRYRERFHRDHSYAYDRERFGGCRTITIERDDGSVRRVRRCD